MDELDPNFKNRISGNICTKCGGEAPDWKCPECGYVPARFDPMHWKDCPRGGKVKAQCKKCGEAEDNCTCA